MAAPYRNVITVKRELNAATTAHNTTVNAANKATKKIAMNLLTAEYESKRALQKTELMPLATVPSFSNMASEIGINVSVAYGAVGEVVEILPLTDRMKIDPAIEAARQYATNKATSVAVQEPTEGYIKKLYEAASQNSIVTTSPFDKVTHLNALKETIKLAINSLEDYNTLYQPPAAAGGGGGSGAAAPNLAEHGIYLMAIFKLAKDTADAFAAAAAAGGAPPPPPPPPPPAKINTLVTQITNRAGAINTKLNTMKTSSETLVAEGNKLVDRLTALKDSILASGAPLQADQLATITALVDTTFSGLNTKLATVEGSTEAELRKTIDKMTEALAAIEAAQAAAQGLGAGKAVQNAKLAGKTEEQQRLAAEKKKEVISNIPTSIEKINDEVKKTGVSRGFNNNEYVRVAEILKQIINAEPPNIDNILANEKVKNGIVQVILFMIKNKTFPRGGFGKTDLTNFLIYRKIPYTNTPVPLTTPTLDLSGKKEDIKRFLKNIDIYKGGNRTRRRTTKKYVKKGKKSVTRSLKRKTQKQKQRR